MIAVSCMITALMLGGVTASGAHDLPGATIIVDDKPGSVVLALTIPLHELALAYPAAGLAETTDLSPDQIALLQAYLRDHVALKTPMGISLPIGFGPMTLGTASNADVGNYELLAVDITAAIPPDTPLFPLELHYDAVLHQVRSQDADVFWRTTDGANVALGEIAYDFAARQIPPFLIPAAP
jgi:hypothetical protein